MVDGEQVRSEKTLVLEVEGKLLHYIQAPAYKSDLKVKDLHPMSISECAIRF